MSSEYTDPRTSTPSAPVYTTDMLNNDININDRVSNLSSTNVSEAAFSAASSISSPNANVNHWGYSLTENNVSGTYNPIPAYNTSQTIRDNVVTSVEHSYTPVTIGVNVDTDIASGTYTNNLVFSTITNPPYVDYTLDFNANTDNAGGDDGSVTNLPADITERVMATSYTVTIPSTAPSRSGYVFNGYNTKADGTGTTYQPGDNYTLVVEDRQSSQTEAATSTLYAIWSQYTYTVTYNCNGGTGCPSSTIVGTENTSYTYTIPSSIPTKEGNNFAGYLGSDNSTYQPGDNVVLTQANNSVILAAQWEAKNYSLQFNINPKSVRYQLSNYPSTMTATDTAASHIFTLPSSDPIMQSYQFQGWNTKADGTGTMYQSGNTFEVPACQSASCEVTLYAIWSLRTININNRTWTLYIGGSTFDNAPTYCPSGFRVPTSAEFESLDASGTANTRLAKQNWSQTNIHYWASNAYSSSDGYALSAYDGDANFYVTHYAKSSVLGIVCINN